MPTKEMLIRLLLEGARVAFIMSCLTLIGGFLWFHVDPEKFNHISFGPPFAILVIAAFTGFITLLTYHVGYFSDTRKEVTS